MTDNQDSRKGMSKPLFRSRLAVNGEIYSIKCLLEVASFIKKYHKGRRGVLAGSCVDPLLEAIIGRDVAVEYRCETQVGEPAQRPQLRPLENFWASLKRKINSNNFVAETEEELINSTKKELKNMPSRMFLSAMTNVPVNCRKATRNSVELLWK